MPVIDSRLGPGTLTFQGPEDFSLQVASAKIVPSVAETDGTPTLGEPDPAPEMTVTWALSGNTISDWSDDEGFVNWAMDNSGTEKTFEFEPLTSAGMAYTGTVQIRPIEIGGDVAVQSSVAFEFPLIGDPTRTYTP